MAQGGLRKCVLPSLVQTENTLKEQFSDLEHFFLSCLQCIARGSKPNDVPSHVLIGVR